MEGLYNKVLSNSGQKILTILKVHKTLSTIEPICVHLQLKENGQKSLKQNNINKRFVYLISPNKIKDNKFYTGLEQVLNSKKVSFFQLRLKNETSRNKISIGKKIKKICKKHRVKFLVNDEPYLAKKLNADGCHIGQKDMNILEIKKILKDKIIGITCHNSINLVKQAIKNQPNYIALGAFYSSKTKKVKFKANIQILKYVKTITKILIVAIGGIKSNNYKKLLLNKANFLAISGYIWNNKKLKPIEAINKLK